MIRRHDTVLVATDFSAGAARALERASRLPLSRPAKLILLHVLPVDAEATQVAAAQELLVKSIATIPRSDDLEITSDVANGKPFEAIIRRSRSVGAGLVVMGRHGRRIRDLLIGSTADRTVRYGDTPVLVVNAEVRGAYARPVVAVSLDDASKGVIELALSVLSPEVKEIDVVHASETPYTELQALAAEMFEQDREVRARRILEEILRSTGAAGAPWRITIRRGDAHASIVNEISSYEADLVVLGTHGRSGLAHAVVGSVAERVLDQAPCDVLVTRPARFTFTMP